MVTVIVVTHSSKSLPRPMISRYLQSGTKPWTLFATPLALGLEQWQDCDWLPAEKGPAAFPVVEALWGATGNSETASLNWLRNFSCVSNVISKNVFESS